MDLTRDVGYASLMVITRRVKKFLEEQDKKMVTLYHVMPVASIHILKVMKEITRIRYGRHVENALKSSIRQLVK